MLSTVMPKMRIKRTQRKLSLPASLLPLILPLLSLCLLHHHQSSDQSVREWPTGLHRGRADLLRAYSVLGPKSFLKARHIRWKPILCRAPKSGLTLNGRSSFCGHSPRQSVDPKCHLYKDNLVISLESPHVHTAGINWGQKQALLRLRYICIHTQKHCELKFLLLNAYRPVYTVNWKIVFSHANTTQALTSHPATVN